MGDAEFAAFKLAFKTAMDHSEWSTIVVTIGVFVEFIALFVFSKDMPPTEKKVMVIATALIVGGCGGEYIYGSRATDAAVQLQDASDAKAKAADELIATAQKAAATAEADAARANERALSLEAQTATAQRDAEQARLEQKRIEVAVAWRSLLPDLQTKLATRLAALSGGTIEISWPGYDNEALALATQFVSTFQQANRLADKELWKVSAVPRLFAEKIFFGVRVNGTDPKKVEMVQQAFTVIGLSTEGGKPIPNWSILGPGIQIGGPAPSDVQVWIGPKTRPD
jgi:hypothetical protein